MGQVKAQEAELEVEELNNVTHEEDGDIEKTENQNHSLDATVSASSVEGNLERLDASKVNDGNSDTRWASEYGDTYNEWLRITYPKKTLVKCIKLELFTRNAEPMNSNIKQFSIKYVDQNGKEKYAVQDFENEVAKGGGWQTDVEIILDEPIIAKELIITEFIAKAPSWNNISIVEVETYSNIPEPKITLDSIIDGIEGDTIPLDQNKLILPEVPEGFSISLNGADFEQIIGNNGEVVHPLVDKYVNVSYVVRDDETGEEKKTGDLQYLVEGKHKESKIVNPKPIVIPEIAEWFSDTDEKLALDKIDKVIYNSDTLKLVAEEFVQDYKEFTGKRLKLLKGKPEKNAFNFMIEAPDQLLGEEGYTMHITSDRVEVRSESHIGNMYGMQSILQMVKQNDKELDVGLIRDYPRFKVRGFMLDVARKPISLEMMKDIARTMRYYKMNDFQVHLSDNYIFLEHYGKYENENEAFKAYEAFRLESSLTNDKGESPTAKDYWISKKNFKSFIHSQRDVGMTIVPEIDVPAHATSFTKVWPELMVKGQVSMLNADRPLIDHFDISKPEAIEKIKEIFDDYTKGTNPTFDSETIIHIGADEFLSDYTAYREFINELVPYIKETNKVRLWGGLTWINDGKTEITKEAIEGVQMNLWSVSWADGLQMYEKGYDLINIIDSYSYMVPNGGYGRGAYGDLLNVEAVFNNFQPNYVASSRGWVPIPSGDQQMLGAAFAIWSDNIDKLASGLTESDLYWRFFDALPFYAEKTWAATGKEKGTASNLSNLAKEMGTGPQTNPYYEENKLGQTYMEYDFEWGLKDKSPNKRHLSGNAVKIENGELILYRDNSHVTSPITKIGNGNSLSFDITVEEPFRPGDIIFETDAPYGTHDIRIMDDGKLGFTRELYEYYFDYVLPVGETVNIRIETEQQKTKLYVDGNYIGDAKGRFVHNNIVKRENITNSTFALPLERIGSRTQAIKARINNIIVKEISAQSRDPYEKSKWKGKTNSETILNEREGLLKYAFDGDLNTIWHSNWTSAQDKLDGSNSFYAEIDFGQKHSINQFSFTPRQDQDSGQVTLADFYIKANKDDDWIMVGEDVKFDANRSKKTLTFDEQEVQYIKFVAKESNDGWVAVSEFDIDNRPLAELSIYLETTEGGQVAGGGKFTENDKVTVKAIPNEGYTFEGWYSLDNKLVSEDDEYTFTAKYNTVLFAKFSKKQYTVIIDGKEYQVEAGSTLSIKDPELPGHRFMGYADSEGNIIDISKPIMDNLELTALFEPYVVEVVPIGDGEILISDMDENGQIMVTVVPNEGYRLKMLIVDDKEIGVVEEYAFVPTSDSTIYAIFQQIDESLELDYQKLISIIEHAKSIDLDRYTEETAEALEKSLDKAISLIDNATNQKSIDAMVEVLEIVIAGLVEKSTDGKEDELNYKNLLNVINQVKGKKLDNYTNESVLNLQKAITKAEALINNAATQEEIDRALETLLDAIASLEIEDIEGNDTEETEDSEDQSDQDRAEKEEKDDSKLPKTGSRSLEIMLIGIGITLAGLFLFIRRQSRYPQ